MKKSATGFTIVELLIVIVVIAILAAISIAAYTGIQNRTNDAAVRSDLRNLAQTIQAWEIENDTKAVLNGASTAGAYLGPGITFAPNKNAHSETYVLYVCRQVSDQSNLVIGSRSMSGNVFAYRVGQGFISYPNPAGTLNGTWSDSTINCPRLLGLTASSDYTFTYARGASSWTAWVK